MRCSIKLLLVLTMTGMLGGCGAGSFHSMLGESRQCISNGQYDQAAQEIMRMISIYPNEPEPYYLLGLVDLANKRYDRSIVNFEKAERRGLEKNDNFYLNKGIALYGDSDLVGAEDAFVQAPSSGAAQKYLGLVRYEFRDFAGATEAFRKATGIKNDTTSLYAFGMSLYYEGANKEALDIMSMAYKLAPDNDKIVFQTANLQMLNGYHAEAAELYADIPPESPYSLKGRYNRAETYIRAGQYPDAVALLDEYTAENPNDYEALYNLSAALIKTGDCASATEHLMRLVVNDTFSTRAAYNLGLAHYRLGNYTESAHYFSRSVEGNLENAAYRYAYGLALSEFGDMHGAEEQMIILLNLDPGNVDASTWLEQNVPTEPNETP